LTENAELIIALKKRRERINRI